MRRRLASPPPVLAAACAALAMLAAGAHGQSQDPALRASQPGPTEIASPVTVPLDTDVLAALPREAVTAQVDGRRLQCEGIPLIALLRATGAVPDGTLAMAHLGRYVLADARDGGRALFSLAELDPGTGARAAFVVDRCDGRSLGPNAGPLRLLVPGDVRAARSLRRLDAITVVVAP